MTGGDVIDLMPYREGAKTSLSAKPAASRSKDPHPEPKTLDLVGTFFNLRLKQC